MDLKNVERFEACANFVQDYVSYLQSEITQNIEMVQKITQDFMELTTAISNETAKHKEEADKILDKTYFDADQETQSLMGSIQSQVDDVFEKASQNVEAGHSSEELDAAARFQRFGGIFSKHMEALATINSSLNGPLLELVGNLSNDDIVLNKLRSFKTSLILFEDHLHNAKLQLLSNGDFYEIQRKFDELKKQTFASYSTVNERKVYNSIF